MSNFSDLFEDAFKKVVPELNKAAQKIDNFIGDVTKGNTSSVNEQATDAAPNTAFSAINIVEGNDKFSVYVAAPGFTKTDIKLQVNEGALVIKGNKEASKNKAGDQYLLHEFGYGTFERAFSVPESVDISKISASYTDGILVITLGKKASAIKSKGITIDF